MALLVNRFVLPVNRTFTGYTVKLITDSSFSAPKTLKTRKKLQKKSNLKNPILALKCLSILIRISGPDRKVSNIFTGGNFSVSKSATHAHCAKVKSGKK